LNEADLVARARLGDEEAWLALVDMHGQPIFRLAYLLTGDADDAADVAQETLLRAFRHLHRFDASRPLQPWLLRIARNLAYNRRRSIRRFVAALRRWQTQRPQDTEPPAASTAHDAVWQALQGLDAKDRDVIYLRYFSELSVAETAVVLGVAEGTVKSRLARALARMRAALVQQFPEVAEESRP
jgi:RNA polymerase sigma-70 factor (ECF subfamily)